MNVTGLKYDASKRKAKFEVNLVARDGTRDGSLRRRKTVKNVATKQMAEKLFAEFKQQVLGVEDGSAPLDPNMTFGQYVAVNPRISKRASRPISDRTAKDEAYALKVRILPALGKVPLAKLSPEHVEDFAALMLKEGLSGATVNNRIGLLHKILVHASKRGHFTIPALKEEWIEKLPENRRENELTVEQVKRFLSAFSEAIIPGGAGGQGASDFYTGLFRDAKPLFVIAVHTGLSRADLLNLRWESVDFPKRQIVVARKKTGVKSVIPLSTAALQALQECRVRRLGEFVFTTAQGVRYSEMTFRRYFLIAKKHAGLPAVTRPHDLRHSCASILLTMGLPIEAVSKVLGHSNSATTRRYARFANDALSPVGRKLDEAFA